MGVLRALQGAPTLVIVCALLFIEEAGVPIPAPGEAVLIGAGLVIAAGGAPPWAVLPILFASVVAGAMTGYGWARWIGITRLRGLARKLRFEAPFNRVTGKLRAAGTREVAVSRLIPGLRIYTTLVAGGAGMELRIFVPALLGAAALWVAFFTLLGVFAGVPAERLIGRAEGVALRLATTLAILAAGYIVIRLVPDSRPATRRVPAGGPRALGAFAIDVMTVFAVVAVLGVFTGLEVGDLETPVSSAVFLTALAVIYLLIARRSIGHTLGELLLRVRYR